MIFTYTPPEDKLKLFLDYGLISFLVQRGHIVVQDINWARSYLKLESKSYQVGAFVEIEDVLVLKEAAEKYFKDRENK